MKKVAILLLPILAMICTSCTKPKSYGNVEVNVGYSINGDALIIDTLAYANAAGNRFLITEIQWFLSAFEFQDANNNWIAMDKIAYIDTNIPESQSFPLSDIPIGHYQRLRFTFGLNEADNRTGRFVNPPERDMFWPEELGGGYHYMKLNGRYLTENDSLAPMNIHLGIGQNSDQSQFFQNYFTLEFPIDLTITEQGSPEIHLTMVIDNWFRNPHTYDFTTFGSAIMQNQEAQQLLKENGHDVFKASPNPQFYTVK